MSKNVLIVGAANTGKSTALRNLVNREKYAYLNTDGKGLPIAGANSFLINLKITNPKDILSFYPQFEESEKCEGVILDTLTFLMAMYERKEVMTSANTQQAWGAYMQFYEALTEQIKNSNKFQIVMAHTDTALNEQTMQMESKILVKGAVGKRGVDADYATVVTCKQMPITKLEGYENPMLTITEEEQLMGVKYVFQTRLTKESVGDRTRSPMGMWDIKESFIDNDIQLVINRLKEFYGE